MGGIEQRKEECRDTRGVRPDPGLPAGRPLRGPNAAPLAGVHLHGDRDLDARHRHDGGHVHDRERRAAAAAAVSAAGPALSGGPLAEELLHGPARDGRRHLPPVPGARPHLPASRCLLVVQGQPGGRGRSGRPQNGRRHHGILRRARRQAGDGTDVPLSRRRGGAGADDRHQRPVVAFPLRIGPGHRREDRQAQRHRPHRRRRHAGRLRFSRREGGVDAEGNQDHSRQFAAGAGRRPAEAGRHHRGGAGRVRNHLCVAARRLDRRSIEVARRADPPQGAARRRRAPPAAAVHRRGAGRAAHRLRERREPPAGARLGARS